MRLGEKRRNAAGAMVISNTVAEYWHILAQVRQCIKILVHSLFTTKHVVKHETKP